MTADPAGRRPPARPGPGGSGPPVIHLVRHGQSTWNAAGRAAGQTDVPLTPLGERQAAAAARRLAGCGARIVCSSDLRRAVATAHPIARALGAVVMLDADLRERALGGFEGQPSAAAWAAPAAAWADPGWRPPGGESLRDVFTRARRFLRRLALQAGGHQVVVVTHGDVASVILAVLCGERPGGMAWRRVANGETVTVTAAPGG